MIPEVRQEIRKILARLQYFAIGKIKEIDLARYMIRAEILTTGMLTNWLRIGEDYTGNNFGHVKSPNIDDEIFIVFPDGDPARTQGQASGLDRGSQGLLGKEDGAPVPCAKEDQ